MIPDRLATHPWRAAVIVALAILFAVQLGVAASFAWGAIAFESGIDWMVLVQAAERIASGENPYAADVHGVQFRWSPLAAWVMVAVAPIGLWAWRAVNLASLALLRDWRVVALALLSWPLWDGVVSGNATTLVVAIGYAALLGSRWAALGYLVLCALIPRPWMAPLALWLIWKRPALRVPALVIALGAIVGAVATGWGDEWMRMLVSSTEEVANDYNIGPTRLLGPAWLIIGVPLGVWLLARGRVGLAGLAVSPYLFAHYYLALLWELAKPRERPAGPAEVQDVVAEGGFEPPAKGL